MIVILEIGLFVDFGAIKRFAGNGRWSVGDFGSIFLIIFFHFILEEGVGVNNSIVFYSWSIALRTSAKDVVVFTFIHLNLIK